MPDDANPAAAAEKGSAEPVEEYPIEFWTTPPAGKLAPDMKPGARGELPPPVSGDRGLPKLPRTTRVSDFWALIGCNAIVFAASVCIMILELTASRLIARYLGNSVYTWTSVIGVVLAGISIGNYLGGWLADKYAPQKVLPGLFLISGLLTFSVLFLDNMAANTPCPEGWNWQTWVMLVVAWVFFLPALSLGTISPVTASMALKRSAKTGKAVGNIYAWGALGSIVGTFLTGFWLVEKFGCHQVIWMTASALVVMGALVAAGERGFRSAALLGALPLIVQFGLLSSTTADQVSKFCRTIAGIRSVWQISPADTAQNVTARTGAAGQTDESQPPAAGEHSDLRAERRQVENEWATWGSRLGLQLHELGRTLALRRDDPHEFIRESDYYTIKITDAREKGDAVKVLTLDHLIHSFYNPQQPAKLYYDYELVYAAITERAVGMRDTRTEVELKNFPSADVFMAAFPSSVKYDNQKKTLSIEGTMQLGQVRQLLTIGPYAEFWQAMYVTWEQALTDWNRIARKNGGVILTDLPELPRGITFDTDTGITVHYDSVLKSLICTGPFSLESLIDFLAQGEMEEYVQAVRQLFNRSRQTSTLFIGGGGYVFPRWIEASFPFEPRIDVAEIDPAVKAVVEQQLGLPTDFGPPDEGKTYVRTHIGDARKFVDDQIRENDRRAARGESLQTYDFVYGDAFNDLSVPWHLTTSEFNLRVSKLLTPGRGVYLVNIIDIYPRAQYPTRSEKAAVLTIEGNPSESLLPVSLPPGAFVSCPVPYDDFAVALQNGVYRLRYNGVMSRERRDELLQGDDDEDVNAREGSKIAELVGALYEQVQARLLTSPLLAEITPGKDAYDEWLPAPVPLQRLQVRRYDNGRYSLAVRGVMPDELRDTLLGLAGADEKFKEAISSLYKRSHAEKTGQFLGRYVNTVRKIFPYVYVFTANHGEPGELQDTFIVVCSLKKLNFENLMYSGGYWKEGPFAWSEVDSSTEPRNFGEMAAILELARGQLLTDDFAPVDNLLAPVFAKRGNQDD